MPAITRAAISRVLDVLAIQIKEQTDPSEIDRLIAAFAEVCARFHTLSCTKELQLRGIQPPEH